MTTQYKQIILKNHKQFLVHKDDVGISKDLINNGEREPNTMAVLEKILKPGSVVLEIGANIGYYTIAESELIGSAGHIYAYEPVVHNVALLKKNLELNKITNCTLFPYAVGDKKGEALFMEAKASNSGTFMTQEVSPWYEAKRAEQTVKSYHVPIVTIDNQVKEMLLPKEIDFVRMDVEGYETNVFLGMDKTLQKMPVGSQLMFELHPVIYLDQYSTVEWLFAFLWKKSFEVTYFDDKPWERPQRSVLEEEAAFSRVYCPHIVMEKV